MTHRHAQLIEQQIVKIVEDANYRAQILRAQGFTKEADEEFATAVLTALLMTRAYCMYNYLEESICTKLSLILEHALYLYIVTYNVRPEDNIIGQVQNAWIKQKEEPVAIPA